MAPVKPSRPKRHFSSAGTIESVNLDAIPLAIARLDNSAAKHKLSVKPKNQRVSKKHRRLAGVHGTCPGWPGSCPCLLGTSSAKWGGSVTDPEGTGSPRTGALSGLQRTRVRRLIYFPSPFLMCCPRGCPKALRGKDCLLRGLQTLCLLCSRKVAWPSSAMA